MNNHPFFCIIFVMEYVVIGKIINTFGIKGELKVYVTTDFVSERFKKGSNVYIGDEYIPMIVKSYHEHKGFLLVLFETYEDINLVERFKNMLIYKSKDDIKPLKEGEYYFSDLRDLDVYINNDCVGKVLRVEEGIRNNNLRIKKLDGKEVLVAYLKPFIEKVDLENNAIYLKDIEGLI